MTTATGGKVWCDCPKFHQFPVTVRTRRRHRQAAGIIDIPDSPLFDSHEQRQLDIDGGWHENGTLPNDDFDGSMMDIDGEGDDRLLGEEDIDERRGIASEDDHSSDDDENSEKEEFEQCSYANPIDSDEEGDFFNDEDESASDEETDETDEMGFGSSDPSEVEDIVLLLQKLKELSGTNLDDLGR